MNDDRLAYVLSKIRNYYSFYDSVEFSKIERWEIKIGLKRVMYFAKMQMGDCIEEFYSRIHIIFDIKYNNIHSWNNNMCNPRPAYYILLHLQIFG